MHEQWTQKLMCMKHTEWVAAELADWVTPGTVIGLDGDLGSGKTTFVQYFAKHIGVKESVSSPTFSLIKQYTGKLDVYHMDVYRISSQEASDLGLEEYFYGNGVSLVEWSERITPMLPFDHLHITLQRTKGDERAIKVDGYGEVCASFCKMLHKKRML